MRALMSCCQWRTWNSSLTSMPSRVMKPRKGSSNTWMDSKSAVRQRGVMTAKQMPNPSELRSRASCAKEEA